MWVSYRNEKIRNTFITVTTTFIATHDVGRQIKAVQETVVRCQGGGSREKDSEEDKKTGTQNGRVVVCV